MRYLVARKAFRATCGIAAACGLLLLLGTAGASDNGIASLPEIILRGGIGLALFFGGLRLRGILQ